MPQQEGCALDAIITVVDCKHIMQHLDEAKPEGVVNEALQQVAFADKMLINKVNLVPHPPGSPPALGAGARRRARGTGEAAPGRPGGAAHLLRGAPGGRGGRRGPGAGRPRAHRGGGKARPSPGGSGGRREEEA